MIFLKICVLCFAGYIIGRIGDWYAGHWDFFHHWIYGIFFIFFGILYGFYFSAFGIGLVISDLKDMLQFKIFGPDEKNIKKFWGID